MDIHKASVYGSRVLLSTLALVVLYLYWYYMVLGLGFILVFLLIYGLLILLLSILRAIIILACGDRVTEFFTWFTE